MRLVIVESPAKAKTINKYLGAGYKVLASYGHIRDLRSKNGSVDPRHDFAMTWEMSDRGKKCVKDIQAQLKKCDELLLATDPDREGEAISWHICSVLNEAKSLNVPFKRIAFHEITKNAIKDAIEHPREIDKNLVDAYLARRALDYLVGFTLSPILWRKLPGSKSAGRVQSVALRIIVEREIEIEAFKPQEYWSVTAEFTAKNKKKFTARLTALDGKKLTKFSINNEEQAKSIVEKLQSYSDYAVSSVESKVVKRNPAPAFITSTLQQEASRKLGFGTKKTMQLAQKLYEGVEIDGEHVALITYMRTDSINLSAEAINKIRSTILNNYGEKFLPEKPRMYSTKVKNAQEAHEAIRPVDAGIIPSSLTEKLPADLLKLYTLVWRRAVACQMTSAEFNQVQVDIANSGKDVFRANGNTLIFEGFLKVYTESKDDSDEQEEDDGMLPPLAKSDGVPLNRIAPEQHFTTPPPRYSEASLVKKMEELGIGRPSTYATIIQVLQDRGYAKIVKKYFVPEIRGRLVTSFLLNFFNTYLQYDFTANMEQNLDDVSNGVKSKLDVLGSFWTGFTENVNQTKNITITDVINELNKSLESYLFKTENGISRQCPECKEGELSLKIGRFGSFIGCSRYPECGYIRKLDSLPEDQSAVSENSASASEFPKTLGTDPDDGSAITLNKGPYGLYVQRNKPNASKKEKPQRSALPGFMPPEQLTLQQALYLLQLPKVIGMHNGSEVKVGAGKFGPYVFYSGKYIRIPQAEDLMTITIDQASELIEKSKKTAGASQKGKKKSGSE